MESIGDLKAKIATLEQENASVCCAHNYLCHLSSVSNVYPSQLKFAAQESATDMKHLHEDVAGLAKAVDVIQTRLNRSHFYVHI